MLKQRIITAAVLVTVVVAGLMFLSVEQFAVAAAAVVALAAWEWANLSGVLRFWQRALYVAAVLLCLYMAWDYSLQAILLLALVFWLSNVFWVFTYPRYASLWKANALLRVGSGFCVLVPFWMALVVLKSEQGGLLWLAYIISLIAGADISAYFTGRRWGKTPLIPKVSPGKTMIGLYASLGWTLFFATLSSWWIVASVLEFVMLVVISLVVVLASILGDLFESMIKRIRGVKDSGQCLPGHGGVMDRIDSLTASLPLFVLAITFVDWLV